jgi:TfoX/Sxy family transcriptional regulator of competence genes
MAFNEHLNDRIREALADLQNVEEKRMFGGSCYMVNDKMCIGVIHDEMMCRVGPDNYEMAVEKPGCREMIFTTRPMKGYVYVAEEALRTQDEFHYWINLCLDFNIHAIPSKKKMKKSGR